MTLSPKLGVVEISTIWHFRLPLPIHVYKGSFFSRLSGIGRPFPILWSHPLKMERIVLLSSLLWWELRTNSLITGPGEWLSFRRFTSKLSRSWSYIAVQDTSICIAILSAGSVWLPQDTPKIPQDTPGLLYICIFITFLLEKCFFFFFFFFFFFYSHRWLNFMIK